MEIVVMFVFLGLDSTLIAYFAKKIFKNVVLLTV